MKTFVLCLKNYKYLLFNILNKKIRDLWTIVLIKSFASMTNVTKKVLFLRKILRENRKVFSTIFV